MGSLISVDRDLTQLDDLLSMPVSSFKPCKSPVPHSHHVKLWRFSEDSQNSDGILTQAVNLTEPQAFKNKQCYLVLIIYSKDSQLKFNGYPQTIWAMLESLNNLTPRGLENIFTSDDSACLDTFLLSRREPEESDMHYMLFVWNGKAAGALVKAFALTKGFELDMQLAKGKVPMLQGLFAGISVRSKTVQQSAIVTLETAFQYDSSTSKKPDCQVYLLQWLWPQNPAPSPIRKPLFPRFKEAFLNNREPPSYIKVIEEKQVPKLSIPVKEKTMEKTQEKPRDQEIRIGEKEKFDFKPKMAALSLSGLKTREEERVQLQHLNKNELDLLDDNFDIRDTNRKEMKLKYYSEVLSELAPGLFVGSDIVARDLSKLRQHGITHIINCAANVCRNYFPSDFTYLHYFLKDTRTESIECIFYNTLAFIQGALSAGGKVLVHCMQGVSRSVTVCLAYVIFTKKLSFEQVYSDAKDMRGICSPNTGFQVQLIWWFKRLCEEYDSLPITPRVFAIGSHQKEQPHTIVARMLTQPLYFGADYFTLDSRGVFLVQSRSATYMWIGNSIPNCNRDLYLVAARKHFELLETYERAVNLVEVQEGKEPEEFWMMWKDERRGSGCVDSWDMWYPRLDKVSDEEPQEMPRESEEEVVETKPKLYVYPEVNGIGVFEDEELAEDAFVCLCTHGKCYSWRGFDNQISEKEEERYFKAVMQDYYGRNIQDIVHEEPGEESDEFLNYF